MNQTGTCILFGIISLLLHHGPIWPRYLLRVGFFFGGLLTLREQASLENRKLLKVDTAHRGLVLLRRSHFKVDFVHF